MAGSLGYCGLDRRRQPLAGDEIRGCWEAGGGNADPSLATAARTVGDETPASGHAAPIEFIEVRGPLASETDVPDLEPAAPGPGPKPPSSDPSPFVPPPGGEPGWSLWGDLDR